MWNTALLAYGLSFGYDTRAMLSRAQEARVRDALANHPPGTIQMHCLEHLAVAATIPPGHLADLAAFIRGLREHGQCETQYGGVCDGFGHDTHELLVWGPPARGAAQRA